ncbi:MAG TPA: putative cytokinetic ring protein SteA, partial [Actinomycetaceae bacterium]|nr:putative cytokinetic ring protein SteA [Actinomycetaceae bacterium]
MVGAARVDARTKNLTKRLQPGEIAVIDHEDIDRVSAEALVACRPAAVLNAASSSSGRYPNLGPEIIVSGGIPLVDDLGGAVMSLREGRAVRVEDGAVYSGTVLVAEGTVQTEEGVAEAMVEAREGLSIQLEAFAGNTMDYLNRER